jgi:hypothetical protein
MERPNLGVPGGRIVEYEQRDHGRDEVRSIDIIQNSRNIHPKSEHFENYASVPLEEAFDWDDIRQKIAAEYEIKQDKALFVFAFYSTPNPEAERSGLDTADRMAFLEARRTKPDDFLYYYRGEPANGKVLSFCIWTEFEHAQAVTHGLWHKEAAKLASASYLKAHTQGYALVPVVKSSTGEQELELIFEHSLKVGKEAA